VIDWLWKSELVGELIRFVFYLFSLEGGTWAGKSDLMLVLLIAVILILPRPFQFVSSVITALIEHYVLKRNPVGFGIPQRSVVRDVVMVVGTWVLSMLTIWVTKLSAG